MSAIDAEHMLNLARRDLKALEGMRDREIFADEVFGFHAQQSVEKALKAWLESLARRYPLTHDLARLLKEITDAGGEISAFQPLDRLTPFSVRLRYDESDEYDAALDRAAVFDEVKALLTHVDGLIRRKP
jgi:hypothetical protein